MNLRLSLRLCLWLGTGLLAAQQGLAVAQTKEQPRAAQASVSSSPAKKTQAESDKSAGHSASVTKKNPEEEPDTIILSDTLHYNDAEKTSVFTGNVIMTRGQMTLRSEKLVMHQDADGYQYGTATAKPNKLVFIRQERPENFEVIEAQGLRAEYNGKTDEIEMIGQAVVTRFICGKEFDKVSGARVKYNQKTNTYEAYAGPNSATKNGRVRSVAQPRAKTDAAVAECKKKSASGKK